jgi:hypothetical protein
MPLRPGELAPLLDGVVLSIDDHGPRGLTGRVARSLPTAARQGIDYAEVNVPPPIDRAAVFDLLLKTGIWRGSLQVWREAYARHTELLAILLDGCVSLTQVDESGQNEAQVFEHVHVLLPRGTTADEFENALSEAFGPELNPMRGRFTLVENADDRASIEAALVDLDGCSCVLIASADEDDPPDAALTLAASLHELPSDTRPACLILVGPHVELPPAGQDSGRDPFDVRVDLQGSPEEAWRAVEQRLDTLDDVELTQAAALAFITGRFDTSRALLQRANAIGHPPSLVTASRLAHDLGEEGARARFEHALLTHHPRHSAARELRVARCVSEGNWSEVAAQLADSSELTPELQYQAALAAFALSETPSMATFLDVVASLADANLDRAWREAIGVLQARNEHSLAVRQVLENDADEQTGASGRVSAVLSLLRQLMLRPPVEAGSTEELERLTSIVLDHVADHPRDLGLCFAAIASFTPNASGSFGISYLAWKLFEDGVASLQLVDTAPPTAPQREASEEEFDEFIRKWLDAISQDHGVIMAYHSAPLPKALLLQPDDAMALLARAARMLAQAADVTGEVGESIGALNMVLSVGLSLLLEFDGAACGIDDIGLFQQHGHSLATGGHPQWARQTATGLLAYGQVASPRQRRRAWRAFADIMHRCGDLVGAFFGAVCSTRIAVESLPTLDRWDELELRIRLFRDLGVVETALSVANDAASLRTRDPRMEQDHVFDDTVASVRLIQLFAMSSTAAASQLQHELDLIAHHYTDSVRKAYAARIGISPPLAMLGQLIRFADDAALEVTAQTRALFVDTLAEFDQRDAQRIRAVTDPRVSFEALLGALHALANVRYASDLAIGLERIRHMARRLLGQGDGASTHELLVAIEVLADPTSARHARLDRDLNTLAHLQAHYVRSGLLRHGAPPAPLLGAPGANPPHAISSLLEDPLAWSHRVTARFVGRTSLCALAVTHDHRVIHLLAREDSPLGPVLESTRCFDLGRFRTWAELYPHGYGMLHRSAPDALSFVEQTLDNIELAGERGHDTCLVFLPTAELMSLPANLLRFHDGHAGATGPTATIPSLEWLESLRVPAIAGEGREAWILPSSVDETRLIPDALGLLLQGGLPAVLEPHGFQLHVDAVPRRTQSPPALALVAAHGAVRTNGSFAYIADERGQRFHVRDILTALDGAQVLLAIICSAGHLTQDRLGGRPLGLPRDALAAGFRAVVASPWPLDAISALEWLPLFLDEWSSGSPLARAVYEANLKLRATRPHPSDWLAMHVYGDYELTMPSPASSASWTSQ